MAVNKLSWQVASFDVNEHWRRPCAKCPDVVCVPITPATEIVQIFSVSTQMVWSILSWYWSRANTQL